MTSLGRLATVVPSFEVKSRPLLVEPAWIMKPLLSAGVLTQLSSTSKPLPPRLTSWEPVDVAEFLAGLADGRGVHDGLHFFQVLLQQPEEERFVPVLEGDQLDVPFEIVRFLAEFGHHPQHLLRLPAAAVGETTAHAAAAAGLRVELVGPGTGGGLGEGMLERLAPASSVIFARGRDVRPELPSLLVGAGHSVLPLTVYRMDPTPPRELPPLGPSLEAVVLTSPRAAELYLRGVGGLPLPCPHWALGPTTRDAAAALGIDCHIPREPTMTSLAEELCTI